MEHFTWMVKWPLRTIEILISSTLSSSVGIDDHIRCDLDIVKLKNAAAMLPHFPFIVRVKKDFSDFLFRCRVPTPSMWRSVVVGESCVDFYFL